MMHNLTLDANIMYRVVESGADSTQLMSSLDVSLTADSMVSSELQWTINAVLDPENFHEAGASCIVL
jgi:hypothetical protein